MIFLKICLIICHSYKDNNVPDISFLYEHDFCDHKCNCCNIYVSARKLQYYFVCACVCMYVM